MNKERHAPYPEKNRISCKGKNRPPLDRIIPGEKYFNREEKKARNSKRGKTEKKKKI